MSLWQSSVNLFSFFRRNMSTAACLCPWTLPLLRMSLTVSNWSNNFATCLHLKSSLRTNCKPRTSFSTRWRTLSRSCRDKVNDSPLLGVISVHFWGTLCSWGGNKCYCDLNYIYHFYLCLPVFKVGHYFFLVEENLTDRRASCVHLGQIFSFVAKWDWKNQH